MEALARRAIAICAITFVALLLFPLSRLIDRDDSPGATRAVDGVIDLSTWNPQRDPVITLGGEWAFYWNRLLTPEDLADSDPSSLQMSYMEVPSVWNGRTAEGQALPAHGSATYRLQLIHLPSDGIYALKKMNIRFASTIFVNGQKLFEDGRTSADAESYKAGNTPQMSLFGSDNDKLEIVVQVSNYDYVNGGITAPLYFGEQAAMQTYQQKQAAREYALLGMLVLLSLIFLFSFIATVIYRRTDYALIVYSVVSLMFAFYNGLMGERALTLFLGELPFETVYRVKDIVSLFSFIVLTLVFYRLQQNLVSRTAALAVSAVLGCAALLVVFLPLQAYIPIYSYIIATYQFMLFGLLLRIGLIYIRGTEQRWKTLLVFAAALCINLYSLDLIFYALAYNDSFWLGQLFLAVFNVLLVMLVVIRFFEAYVTVDSMKDQLLLADRIKDEFLSNTSHELRTPLNAMVNIADTLLQGAGGSLDGEKTKNLEIIVGSGRRLSHLVDDLIEYSRMKHDDIELSKSFVDLYAAVDTVARMHRFLLEGKPIAIVNDIPDEFPAVWADANRLHQILHNLLGNAIKFTEQGRVTITSRIVRNRAEVQVTDTGAGIEPSLHERIFLPFEQAESSKALGGSGLGLSIVKKLVELHDGDIRVQSEPGQGAAFVFTLPLADGTHHAGRAATAGQHALPAEPEAAAGSSYPLHFRGKVNEPVLVVDDDYANLQTMINLLRLEGHTFTVVNSGQAAMDEIDRHPGYSLVILDIMMPGMSGYEVLRRLRERFSPSELPVLMLTARTRSEDVKLSLENGANDIVGKPFVLEELAARVHSLTRLKSSARSANQAEISFLRSQIKPHFLFNALNSIAELCVEEPLVAEQLIVQLSQYLRMSFAFKKMDADTTLASELELVRAYVHIERARFGSRLNVEYDIAADAFMRMPPLLLQPLVENAIRHGLMSKPNGGMVTVSARYVERDRVLFIIADNGCGMSEQTLREIMQRGPESPGVGLWNIRKQIKLIYGADIRIESEPGEGTSVSFVIPANKGEGEDIESDHRGR